MPESQNIEYKTNWRDEYLKWICGFANASGGKLYIGIDDKDKVTGIDNHNKLLEDLPNKFRDILGVYAEVNLHEKSTSTILKLSFPVMMCLFPLEVNIMSVPEAPYRN